MNEFVKSMLHIGNRENFLCHHGILGMHWGIRRYQDYGHGGYDPDHEGKFVGKSSAAYNKELKKQLKKRDAVIKDATLAAMNRTSAMKKVAKYQVKKTENATGHYDDNIERANKAYEYWDKRYKKLEIRGKQMTTRLKNLYGDEYVKDLPYKNGIIKGAVFSPTEAAIRATIMVAAISTISPTTTLLSMPSKTVQARINKVKTERQAGIQSDDKFDKVLGKALDTVESLKDKAISTIERHRS